LSFTSLFIQKAVSGSRPSKGDFLTSVFGSSTFLEVTTMSCSSTQAQVSILVYERWFFLKNIIFASDEDYLIGSAVSVRSNSHAGEGGKSR
jgi:hypothetical protein